MSIQKDIIKLLEKYDEDGASYDGFILIGFADDGVTTIREIDEPYKALGALTVVQKRLLIDVIGE